MFAKEGGEFVCEVRQARAALFTPWSLAVSDELVYATDDNNHCVTVLEG